MKPLTITPEQFKQACDINRILIECIFQREESFKKKFVVPYRAWSLEDYTIGRVHFSGSRARVEIVFKDCSTKSIYVELDEIYDWYLEESK